MSKTQHPAKTRECYGIGNVQPLTPNQIKFLNEWGCEVRPYNTPFDFAKCIIIPIHK